MKKLIKKSFHRKEKGFTLIELLIVIVIIGILAGVLIAVINPVRQQNRSRNAAIKAAVLKASFAVNTVRAGTGSLPSNSSLTTELENLQPGGDWSGVDADGNPISGIGCDLTSDTTLDCYFTLSGTQLPAYCSNTDLSIPVSGGTEDCLIRLVSTSTDLRDGQFRIAAPQFPLDSTAETYYYYIFDSSQGLMLCPNSTAAYEDGEVLVGDTGGCTPVSNE
jgi:prepilin-type N-terminal cleavage/methylation domain-containing protein